MAIGVFFRQCNGLTSHPKCQQLFTNLCNCLQNACEPSHQVILWKSDVKRLRRYAQQ